MSREAQLNGWPHHWRRGPNGDPDMDTNPNTNPNTNTDGDPNAYSIIIVYSDGDEHTITHTESNPDRIAFTLANADPD